MIAGIDEHPLDCSVYGVRHLAGNVRLWCRDAYCPVGGEPVPTQRTIKGGCFHFGITHGQAAARVALEAHRKHDTIGFHLVCELG